MYEDQTQNYDPEILEEYLVHDILSYIHLIIAMCRLYTGGYKYN